MESYAVIQTGGKQYRVKPGDIIRVEKITGEIGSPVLLKPVLASSGEQGFRVGAPELCDIRVKGTVTDQIRDRKVISFKKKRRKGYSRKVGHRQSLTVCRIDTIEKLAPQEQETDHGS